MMVATMMKNTMLVRIIAITGAMKALVSRFMKHCRMHIVRSLCQITSHKLQQKQTQQISTSYYVLNDRKKVLKNPLGGKV